MDQDAKAGDRGVETSLKATYRALLARGLEAGEAANLTAFLHGLPSTGLHWTLPEIEAIVRRKIDHAAGLRDAGFDRHPNHPSRHRTTIHDRRRFRAGSTHVIDPPTP